MKKKKRYIDNTKGNILKEGGGRVSPGGFFFFLVVLSASLFFFQGEKEKELFSDMLSQQCVLTD